MKTENRNQETTTKRKMKTENRNQETTTKRKMKTENRNQETTTKRKHILITAAALPQAIVTLPAKLRIL
eukprot:snap_masked-scaffold_35-processed-gene-1.29-mRNA-1 protein AED:1.00 eAED:1.00 QI:0/-1/0/0/-1/1/1/0/68